MPTDTLYIILALFMAAASGLVGSFALMRKLTLASDAISHIALPGLGLALLYGWNPILGGAVTLIAGVVLIWKVEKLSGINTDAIIGVIFAISLALGSLLTPEEELIEALFGGLATIAAPEFTLGMALSALVIGFILKNRHALVLSLMSKDLAKTAGVNVDRLNLLFLVVFALAIILGLRYLGVLLMGSLIIIPAAIAKNISKDLNTMLVTSALAAMASITLGILASEFTEMALGPLTIGAAGLIFFGTLFRKRFGVQ